MADPALDLSGSWGDVRALPPARRWVLHGDQDNFVACTWPGGLPREMLRSTATDAHAAPMLGPDEWLLMFGKAEVVLWRPDAGPLWRMELWRSFAPYVASYLRQAVADL